MSDSSLKYIAMRSCIGVYTIIGQSHAFKKTIHVCGFTIIMDEQDSL